MVEPETEVQEASPQEPTGAGGIGSHFDGFSESGFAATGHCSAALTTAAAAISNL